MFEQVHINDSTDCRQKSQPDAEKRLTCLIEKSALLTYTFSMLEDLVVILAADITNKYKISQEEVRDSLRVSLQNNQKLNKLALEAKNIKDIRKTREFRDFYKAFKKDIYYKLRRYKEPLPDETIHDFDKAAASHVSTRERLKVLEFFNGFLNPRLKNVEYILDVGGGLFPLIFAPEAWTKIKNFVWIDKDKESYEILLRFKEQMHLDKLVLLNINLNDVTWKDICSKTGTEKFDMALMLKLIPVIARQEKHLLGLLSKTPAKKLFITASKEAMVKKIDITKREDVILRKFIKLSGRAIEDTFDSENEFGYLLA